MYIRAACLLLVALCVAEGMNFRFPGSNNRFVKNAMNNVKKFNVDRLLGRIRSGDFGPEGPVRFKENRRNANRRFGGSDRGLAGNQKEKNARSIFGSSKGNEFVTTDTAADRALKSEAKASLLVDEAGVDQSELFSADGTPLTAEVARIAANTSEDCVFDVANQRECQGRFREPTGRCTNAEAGKKTWGMAGTPYARLLTNKYEDGLKELRLTEHRSGNTLKSSREISVTVTDTAVVLNRDGPNAHVMQWGQFIAHEFTLIGEIEKDVVCCPDVIFKDRHGDGTPTKSQIEGIREEVKDLRGGVCMQVEHHDDPVFNDYVCMHQVRSKPSPKHDCSLGPRQQMNLITHVFDGSAIYGSSKKESDDLRSKRGGKMKVQTVNGATLPPQKMEGCPAAKKQAKRCPFLAGDERINTTPNLIATHAAFLNFHNKLADQLSALNSHWDDERTYQETRRIVAAVQSNIHYYEYLPIVIGSTLMNAYKLTSHQGFKPDVNPAILNELAGAAFRFGHSQIDGFISLEKDDGTSDFTNLRPLFFDSDIIYTGGIKQCIKGLSKDIPWIKDSHFPTQMRNELFDKDNDIVSININRGRDHGFASYMDYRRFYGLSVPRDWNDLTRTHPANVRDQLKKVYTSVEDIELYIGGVTENKIAGALVGETFGNIIGDGFARTRDGDRFFFENDQGGLTKDQIDEIKKIKLSSVLCQGAEISKVTRNAFFKATTSNPSVDCSSIRNINVALWKEEDANTNACFWRVTNVSKCCNGKKTTKRVCEGASNTCSCQGRKTVKERCSCGRYDWSCTVNMWTSCGGNRWWERFGDGKFNWRNSLRG